MHLLLRILPPFLSFSIRERTLKIHLAFKIHGILILNRHYAWEKYHTRSERLRGEAAHCSLAPAPTSSKAGNVFPLGTCTKSTHTYHKYTQIQSQPYRLHRHTCKGDTRTQAAPRAASSFLWVHKDGNLLVKYITTRLFNANPPQQLGLDAQSPR